MAIPVPGVDRTDYLLILGANPLVSNGSMMTAPRDEAAPARPAHFAAVASSSSIRGAADSGSGQRSSYIRVPTPFPAQRCSRCSLPKTSSDPPPRWLSASKASRTSPRWRARLCAERVATATGMAADTIRRIARETFGEAHGGLLHAHRRLRITEYGTLTSYLGDVVRSGHRQYRSRGAAPCFKPAAAYPTRAAAINALALARLPDLPEFGGERRWPGYRRDQTGGPGQIRGMIRWPGIPVLSTPTAPGWKGGDGHARLHGQRRSSSERDDAPGARSSCRPRHSLEIRTSAWFFTSWQCDTVKFSEPLFPPAADSLSSGEIWSRLAAELIAAAAAPIQWRAGAPVDNRGRAVFRRRRRSSSPCCWPAAPVTCRSGRCRPSLRASISAP